MHYMFCNNKILFLIFEIFLIVDSNLNVCYLGYAVSFMCEYKNIFQNCLLHFGALQCNYITIKISVAII